MHYLSGFLNLSVFHYQVIIAPFRFCAILVVMEMQLVLEVSWNI